MYMHPHFIADVRNSIASLQFGEPGFSAALSRAQARLSDERTVELLAAHCDSATDAVLMLDLAIDCIADANATDSPVEFNEILADILHVMREGYS
jgi:hypothetical protein